MIFESGQKISGASIREHFQGILTNWGARWDSQVGGIPATVRPDGTVRESARRALLIQARCLYNFSEGIAHGEHACSDLAAQLFDYLCGQLRSVHGWFCSLGSDGELQGQDGLFAYDNLFMVIACARYARVAKDPKTAAAALQVAQDLFALIDDVCGNGDLAEGGILSRGGEEQNNRQQMRLYSGNVMLHYLEAAVNVRLAGVEAADQKISDLRTFFLRYIYDEQGSLTLDHFRDGFKKPRAQQGASTTMGHSLEWIDFFRVCDRFHLPEKVERSIFESVRKRGVQESGLFVNHFYLSEMRSAGSCDFWGQAESIKAYNIAASLYGYPYADTARNLLEAYFKYFVDTDHGVFNEVDPNGVVLSRMKGYSWKCDYHSLRMCVDIMDREGGIGGVDDVGDVGGVSER
ncbi:MAG: AGE family epimerase/isomerase [Planctomycetes bacterium]|nr:AGE family epimerase/isomerase [Planctomycetota bacterium]